MRIDFLYANQNRTNVEYNENEGKREIGREKGKRWEKEKGKESVFLWISLSYLDEKVHNLLNVQMPPESTF